MTTTARQRPLLFGGTFDPPHNGHVALSLLATEAIGADAIWVIPAGRPPHRAGPPAASARHRLAMARLAWQRVPDAAVLEAEVVRAERGETTYTVDTLADLGAALGPHASPRLLLGTDQLATLDRWREPERILRLAEPAVLVRAPETAASALSRVPPRVDDGHWAGRLLELPRFDVSASGVRDRLARGRPVAGLVPGDVEDYLREAGLYLP